MQLKTQTNANEIENLYQVTFVDRTYYFQGDLEELKNNFIQKQFENFYPYQDTNLVNDIRAFDRSVTTDLNDSPRDIVSLMGFSDISEYKEQEEPMIESDEVSEPIEKPIDENQTEESIESDEDLIKADEDMIIEDSEVKADEPLSLGEIEIKDNEETLIEEPIEYTPEKPKTKNKNK